MTTTQPEPAEDSGFLDALDVLQSAIETMEPRLPRLATLGAGQMISDVRAEVFKAQARRARLEQEMAKLLARVEALERR